MSSAVDNHPGARLVNPVGRRELIMVVDDEEYVTLLAERVLMDAGYRVVTARDGFQAVEIFKKLAAEVKLVILDFVMPIMDGPAVFRAMRRINPRLPVVVISGFISQEKLDSVLGEGLCGFFPKPLAPAKLLLNVRLALDATQGKA
jgi:two-component system cell cycle sensor histidine kinase/response regulator CckA